MMQFLEMVGWWIGWAVFALWLAVLVWWTCGGGRQHTDWQEDAGLYPAAEQGER